MTRDDLFAVEAQPRPSTAACARHDPPLGVGHRQIERLDAGEEHVAVGEPAVS